MKKLCSVILILFVFLNNSRAQSSYYRLQAVYLFNFAKYIKWTSEPATFVIGVFGSSEISGLLQKSIEGKKVGGKTLDVFVFKELEQAAQCQIVYLPRSKSKQLTDVADLVTGKGILIVTEEDLSRKGAAISFFVENESLKFKLNHDVFTKSGLSASPGLLSLAVIVNDK